MKTDRKSVERMLLILLSNIKSMKDVKISLYLYCPYDLYTQDTLIELKLRYMPSWSFEDNMCETDKVRKILSLILSGLYKRAYLISTYTDGVIRISKIQDGDVILRDANHNTYFSDRTIIEKKFYSIKIFNDYVLENGLLKLKEKVVDKR